jgi:hypothetical protein
MDLTVAVRAAAIEEKNRGRRAWSGRMLRGHVTSSAESRVGNLEQPIIHGPVRFMAVGTIFHCGWMLPKEGTASFGVARVTVFIDAVLLQLSWARASVRIVTVSAGHFSLADGHVRRT